MKVRKNILPIMILLLFSCNGKKEKEIKSKSEAKIDSVTEIETESELDKDYSQSAKLFAQEVLNDKIRIHSFDLSGSDKPTYLSVFQSDGLLNIEAYSNKNYPKNSEPNYYEHFTLFVANYKSTLAAKNSFDQIKSDSKHGLSDLNNLDGKLAERTKLLTIGAKPGGMITHNGHQVFSLVETCRETPNGNKWIDYENLFLKYITENGEEIEVLNANCGMDRYQLERRKANTQQNL